MKVQLDREGKKIEYVNNLRIEINEDLVFRVSLNKFKDALEITKIEGSISIRPNVTNQIEIT